MRWGSYTHEYKMKWCLCLSLCLPNPVSGSRPRARELMIPSLFPFKRSCRQHCLASILPAIPRSWMQWIPTTYSDINSLELLTTNYWKFINCSILQFLPIFYLGSLLYQCYVYPTFKNCILGRACIILFICVCVCASVGACLCIFCHVFVCVSLCVCFVRTCSWINSNVNAESSRINLVVSIWKITFFSAYWEPVTMLRDLGKSNNTTRILYSSDFLTE